MKNSIRINTIKDLFIGDFSGRISASKVGYRYSLLVAALFCLLMSIDLNAATYYLSSSVSTDGDGSMASPWKSLSKLRTFTIKPGDSILLKRGDYFYGELIIIGSGTSTSKITIGAYGSGSAPVITGFKKVTNWTSLGNNLWESTEAVSTLPKINMVAVNGVNTAMGRWPNSGRLKVDSYSGTTSITSSGLSGSTINWKGAELVLFDSAYTLTRKVISSQSGQTLTYSGYRTPGSNKGFFIQNDPRALDAQNEWYYNPVTRKLLIYSTTKPANVQVSTIDGLVSLSKRDYIQFENLSFQGANKHAIFIDASDSITFDHCSIDFAGVSGIRSEYSVSTGLKVTNCSINHCNTSGILLLNTADGNTGPQGALIQSNTVKNAGVLPGMISSESIAGISARGPNHVVEYNVVDNVAYAGIYFFGNNTVIRNNVVNHFDQVLQDAGGIYTWNAPSDGTPIPTTGMKVLKNIVMNGGATEDKYQKDGIYLDNFSNHIEVAGNTVFNVGCGILANFGNKHISMHDNTVYRSLKALCINGVRGNCIASDIDVQKNIFVVDPTQQAAWVYFEGTTSLPASLTMDYNYYARPMDDTTTIQRSYSGSSKMSLATWQSQTSKDLHSKKSPKTITQQSDLVFEYNDSTSPLSLSFPGMTYIDMTGKTYVDSVLLQPYSSIVLVHLSGSIDTNIAPTISTQPASTTVTEGQTATFSVVAKGTPSPKYQWMKNGTIISGATSASYTTPATKADDNNSKYKVVVSNVAGSKTSNEAILTVKPAIVLPSIKTQPVSQNVLAGQTATFSVVATGTPSPTYQWMKNGVAISGATSPTYTTPSTVAGDNGAKFTVTVKNDGGSITSSAAILTVTVLQISTLTLINADTDQDIGALKTGDTLNLATLPTRNINIRANTNPSQVGSVVFNLTGTQTLNHTENSTPYAMNGNSGTDYTSWSPLVGSYTLKVTPFSASSGTGMAGTAMTINFKVIDQKLPALTSSLSTSSTMGSSFTYLITAAENPTSYGAKGLPPGLNLNSTSGLISGTPTTYGNFSVTISASNSAGTTTGNMNLTIKQPSALFVVGSTMLNTGDAAIKARLESMGYLVLLKTGAESATSDAAGKNLVFISSTPASSSIGTKFRDVAVPVLTWEAYLFDDLGMTGGVAGTDYLKLGSQSAISIINSSHPMAAGLSGLQTVYSTAGYLEAGVVNSNAIKIATSSSDPSKVVLFGYEKGAVMPGLAAPARRVGFFIYDNEAANMTPQGWALFESAVKWAQQ